MWKVLKLSIKKPQRKMLPVFPRTPTDPTGWTWSSFPGLRSPGATAAPRPISTACTPPPCCICALKTRLSTSISPPYHFPPIPPKQQKQNKPNLFLKACFSTTSCSGVDRCLTRFLSSIHERRRGRSAHVNTGNDTDHQNRRSRIKAKV